MAISSDWEFCVKSVGQCTACQAEFSPGQEYFAVLYQQDKTLIRKDFCQTCYQDPPQDTVFSFWKARLPEPQQRKKLLVDDQVLTDLFLRISDDLENTSQAFRFILALILMRKRILKYLRTERDENNQEVWIMKLARKDNEHRVVNPQLDEQQLQEVRDQLSAILAGNNVQGDPTDADDAK